MPIGNLRGVVCGNIAIAAGTVLLFVAPAYPDEFEGVRAQIHDVMAAQNVPSVAVAVARGGHIVWEEGFGWADMAKRVPATAHTLYALASISKPVTATALMILVERGAIDLDRPMNDYLGDQKLSSYVGDANEATVRRVANHTSGLPFHYHFYYEDESVPRPPIDERIRRYGILVRPPGEAFRYSNFGYGLIEYAIERASGKTYAEFLRQEIFLPLGLTESAVNRSPNFGDRVAVRYMNNRAVPFYDSDNRGAAGVFMSAHDLVRFGMFHLDDRLDGQKQTILPRGTIASMRERPAPNSDDGKSGYGIGWMIGESHGLTQFGHSGGMAGVATDLTLYPEANVVVVVLANAEAAVEDIEASIIHRVLPDTIHNDHGFKPPPEVLGRWKGVARTYVGDVPLEFDFRQNGSVFASVGSGDLQEVVNVKLDPKWPSISLSGIAGDLGTPDAATHPYQLQYALTFRAPGTLNGAVSAIARPLPYRVGGAVSYWAELHKIDAERR